MRKKDFVSLLEIMDPEEYATFKIGSKKLKACLFSLSCDGNHILYLDDRSATPIKYGKIINLLYRAIDLPINIIYNGELFEILAFDRENNIIRLCYSNK